VRKTLILMMIDRRRQTDRPKRNQCELPNSNRNKIETGVISTIVLQPFIDQQVIQLKSSLLRLDVVHIISLNLITPLVTVLKSSCILHGQIMICLIRGSTLKLSLCNKLNLKMASEQIEFRPYLRM
jgi:hypothetical protein